eukprot:c14333_g1_i1 orf=194-1000(+)
MPEAQRSLLTRWRLDGHVALVTGSTRGIGRAIAEELSALGAYVYICARTSADVEKCLKTWREAGLSVAGTACDLSSRQARMQLMQEVSEHFQGKLDILVNNVGTSGADPQPIQDVEEQEYLSIMSANLESAFHLSQLAYPLLKASTRGNVVFISSISGITPMGFPVAVYNMTKAAINDLTKNMACEWSKDSIRVNCVAPGYVHTDLTDKILSDPEIGPKILKDIPMGRAGEPEEIAAAVAFFCMPCSSFCSGQVLVVDGGSMIHGLFG